MTRHKPRRNRFPHWPLITLLLLVPAGITAQEGVDTAPVPDENAVELLVYKKWIGASGDESDVEIHLNCGGLLAFEPRFINRDRPDGWTIEGVPADGQFCDVREMVLDSFVADVGDCLDLLVVPGQDVECTMVNTKVVKRIDMLNRYGLIMMVAVMLGAGLAAVKRFGPTQGRDVKNTY